MVLTGRQPVLNACRVTSVFSILRYVAFFVLAKMYKRGAYISARIGVPPVFFGLLTLALKKMYKRGTYLLARVGVSPTFFAIFNFALRKMYNRDRGAYLLARAGVSPTFFAIFNFALRKMYKRSAYPLALVGVGHGGVGGQRGGGV